MSLSSFKSLSKLLPASGQLSFHALQAQIQLHLSGDLFFFLRLGAQMRSLGFGNAEESSERDEAQGARSTATEKTSEASFSEG